VPATGSSDARASTAQRASGPASVLIGVRLARVP
jgi:hypothetical protein